ncbi:hypothetical protein [Streptomyces sp. NPDC012888]|uniref:hypothetical protein n=1 Tax=Streptomyces sp. NPDC012888 TaxID=3364855 RepID=UPI003683E996
MSLTTFRTAMAATTLALACTLLGGPPASAAQQTSEGGVSAQGTFTWTRSCGTTYRGTVTQSYAETTKYGGGSCKGYAWVRVQHYGVWGDWVYHPTNAAIHLGSGITAAQHRGCGECAVYTRYP